MKRLTMIAVVISLFIFRATAQGSGYTITGNIKDLPDGITFYLIKSKDGGGPDTSARIKSKASQFVFKGSLEEEGLLVFVKMDTTTVKVAAGKPTWARLFLDNSGETIKLTGTLSDWPEVKIEGAKLTEEYDQVSNHKKTLVQEINEKIDEAKGDSSKIATCYKEYSDRYLKILEAAPSPAVVPLFLYGANKIDLDLKDAAYQKLSARLKDSYYGKRLKQQIINTKGSKMIGIGKVVPDFMVRSPEGRIESVRDLAKRSKYTLVDFWAYWCKPCRADIPDMKKVYNAFHDKGFNILSVSTDPNDVQWKKALKEENTPWLNGMQQGNVSKDTFGINAIPGYILLNEKAEIVMMDIISTYFSNSIGTVNGMQVFANERKSLRGNDLYEVIGGLFGEGKK